MAIGRYGYVILALLPFPKDTHMLFTSSLVSDDPSLWPVDMSALSTEQKGAGRQYQEAGLRAVFKQIPLLRLLFVSLSVL